MASKPVMKPPHIGQHSEFFQVRMLVRFLISFALTDGSKTPPRGSPLLPFMLSVEPLASARRLCAACFLILIFSSKRHDYVFEKMSVQRSGQILIDCFIWDDVSVWTYYRTTCACCHRSASLPLAASSDVFAVLVRVTEKSLYAEINDEFEMIRRVVGFASASECECLRRSRPQIIDEARKTDLPHQ